MNIYALFPLVAIVAYIPLLAITISSRPWGRQQQLFALFLVSAILWSLSDFFCRSNYFLEHSQLLGGMILIMFTWMSVQFHTFTSSYFAPGQGRWLVFAYTSLAAVIVVVALGYLPRSMEIVGDKVYPDYGAWVLLIAIPLLTLLSRNIFVFSRRLKTLDSPVLYNQIVALLVTLIVLSVFSVAALMPWGREFPVSHFGNIINAFILSYATVGHQLVDIRFVMRRALGGLTLALAGGAMYLLFLLAFHFLLGIDITVTMVAIGMAAAGAAGIVAYLLRGVSQGGIDRVFSPRTYDYRQQLLDFIGRIHNVFSLKELSGEMLPLIVMATKCKRAGLFLPESSSGDFVAQFVEPTEKGNPLSELRMRYDNPIVRYLGRKHRLLTIQNLGIMPEFYGLWEQERELIKSAEVELFMPVISRGKLVGVLVLSRKESGRYLLEDINLLEEITGRVAVSLERGYLHEEVKQRQEELALISHLAAIMTSSLDIREICDRFIKELKKVVEADWVAIIVIEGEALHFLALSSEVGSAWQVGDRIPMKGTGIEWTVGRKKALVEPDLAQESRFWTGENHLRQGLHSIVHLPLLVDDKVIGSLSLASRRAHAYGQNQVQLLSQLASQIAMPIENARLYAEAEQLARLDQLTGLWNRRHLEERIQVEIGRHSRYGGIFSLVILDLDSFKAFNDNYGHLAGDKLLKQLGAIMKSTVRASDEAFRYGGDEFAILLTRTGIKEAYEVAERVRSRVAAEIKVGESNVSASFGLASWPVDGVRINEIIAAADMALYYAKQSGGNQSHAISELLPTLKERAPKPEVEPDRGAFNLICALAAAVDAKDHYAYKHSQNVREYTVAFAKSLPLPPQDIARLSTCALLHDIGKIGISDEILNKADELTAEEWEVMRSHPQLGADIVSHVPQLAPCLGGILYHHERYDGSGYPAGLNGEAIPMDARIIGIADAFAAMTSARPYRAAFTVEEAFEELRRSSGSQFDAGLVKTFIVAIKAMPVITS